MSRQKYKCNCLQDDCILKSSKTYNKYLSDLRLQNEVSLSYVKDKDCDDEFNWCSHCYKNEEEMLKSQLNYEFNGYNHSTCYVVKKFHNLKRYNELLQKHNRTFYNTYELLYNENQDYKKTVKSLELANNSLLSRIKKDKVEIQKLNTIIKDLNSKVRSLSVKIKSYVRLLSRIKEIPEKSSSDDEDDKDDKDSECIVIECKKEYGDSYFQYITSIYESIKSYMIDKNKSLKHILLNSEVYLSTPHYKKQEFLDNIYEKYGELKILRNNICHPCNFSKIENDEELISILNMSL